MQFRRSDKRAHIDPEIDQLVRDIVDIEDLLTLLEILKHWGVSPENLPELLEAQGFVEDPPALTVRESTSLTPRERVGLLITAAFFLLLTLLNALYG